MKRLIFISILILPGFLIFPACRKCTSCTVKIKSTGAVDTVIPEFCGSSKKNDDFTNSIKAVYPDSVFVVTCLGYDGKR